jgi:hypothetical protein
VPRNRHKTLYTLLVTIVCLDVHLICLLVRPYADFNAYKSVVSTALSLLDICLRHK